MSEKVEVEYSLTVNIEEASTKVRQFERMFMRILSLFNRMGLPDNVQQGIIMLERLISTVRMLRISMLALEAASGPVGWLYALMGVVSGSAMAGELLMDIRSQLPEPPFIP